LCAHCYFVGKMVNVRVSEDTLKKLYQLKAWFELGKGEKYSLDKTLNELISTFLEVVKVPWETVEQWEEAFAKREKVEAGE
jgi:hypothetical protein